MIKHTTILLAAGAFLAYGANGYVDVDKLDRYVAPSKTETKTKKEPRQKHIDKVSAKRLQKYRRVRSPEALIKMRSRGKQNLASRHLGRHGYDRLPTPEAYLSGTSHPHRFFKRRWVLAYRYDQASFVDRYGYRYDRFDRYGFTFEGYYFRYNARYRYRDRVRGRGYFDRFYYAPLRASYYGFCP